MDRGIDFLKSQVNNSVMQHGAETGMAKQALGKALGMARDLADAARESDFLRLVGDIVTARQSEDTFKTFREAGRMLGITRLAQIGEMGERDHDEYVKEANRLVAQLFVEHVRSGDTTGLVMTPGATASSSGSMGTSTTAL
jgi:hypothetical protein